MTELHGGMAALRALVLGDASACIVCRDKGAKVSALVSFKLASGTTGEMCGLVHKRHKAGHDWRGVGSVTNITRGVKLITRKGHDGQTYQAQHPGTPKAVARSFTPGTVNITGPKLSTVRTLTSGERIVLSYIKHMRTVTALEVSEYRVESIRKSRATLNSLHAKGRVTRTRSGRKNIYSLNN